MKRQKMMKTQVTGLIAMAVTLAALSASPLLAEDAVNPAPPAPPAAVAPKTDATASLVSSLSGPTREVVKMAVSGVSEEVLKAYVYHSPSAFNLTADSIIHLKGVGVSADVLAAMLNRDTMLRDQNALIARGQTQTPMVQPTAPTAPPADSQTAPANPSYDTASPDYSATTPPPDNYYYYPDYTYGYPYYGYPYGYYGGWYFTAGRGWAFFPHGRFGGGRGFIGVPFGGRGGFGGRESFGGGHSGGGHGGGGGHH